MSTGTHLFAFHAISLQFLSRRELPPTFPDLDSAISLHQRKHEKLVTLKVAMRQKMFPHPGGVTPEIRFKGYSGKWKKFKLGDICDVVGGGTPSTSIPDYWDGTIDWYSPTEIGDKAIVSGSKKRITNLGLSKCSARVLPAHKTILFTSRAGIGDMAILSKEGCTSQGFQSFIISDDIDPYFLYSMGHLIGDFAKRNASGSTFWKFQPQSLEEWSFRYQVIVSKKALVPTSETSTF
ncbi:MAG: restriction endonuclease subunit S [Aquabacterium sp.]